MDSFLEKLRQKPERTRKRIAFASSSVIVGLIAIVWISTKPFSVPSQSVTTIANNNENPSPLEVARQNLGAAYASLKNQFGSVNNDTEASSTAY